MGTCSTCHQLEGQGLASVFPPLAKSDYLMADPERAINTVLKGLSGPIEVNGQKYDNVMPPLANLTDHEIADVLTFVRNSFGNQGDPITTEQVARARAAIPKDKNGGHP
jgi:nitrite reductase (NO-forming)